MSKAASFEQEARVLMGSGLGRAELEFAISVSAPLFWLTRDFRGNVFARNGTAFFLDTGMRVFGVTANHVVEGWKAASVAKSAGTLRLGSLPIDWSERAIEFHPGIDIATFNVTRDEVAALGKCVLSGGQGGWPPRPPDLDCGTYYNGYAGIGTRVDLPTAISFGAVAGAGIASSVSETDVSMVIEREHLIPVLGGGVPPENFDFGGISGGPMLTVVEGALRYWRLAGVVVSGPNTSLAQGEAIAGMEVIYARRADLIQADGTLDTPRWHALRGWRE